MKTTLLAAALGLAVLAVPGHATVLFYTSSADFIAATSPYPVQILEDFSADVNDGDVIPSGGALHGITYSNFGGFSQAVVTNLYNSFSGQSLGADHTDAGPGQTFFYIGDTIDITFSIPVYAVGIFFNVNPNSGSYHVATSAGTASSDSATYDTSTFVFAGLVSDTPFTTATLSGADVFNVPEILAASGEIVSPTTPEPAGFVLAGLGLAAIGFRRFASKSQSLRP